MRMALVARRLHWPELPEHSEGGHEGEHELALHVEPPLLVPVRTLHRLETVAFLSNYPYVHPRPVELPGIKRGEASFQMLRPLPSPYSAGLPSQFDDYGWVTRTKSKSASKNCWSGLTPPKAEIPILRLTIGLSPGLLVAPNVHAPPRSYLTPSTLL